MQTRHRFVAFAGLVIAGTAAVFLARLDRNVTPFVLVIVPPAAALMVSGLSGGTAEVLRLLRRLGVWRVSAWWYLAALGIPLIEKIIVDVVGVLTGGSTPAGVLSGVTASALLVPLVVLVPGLLEELGWRGFGMQTLIDQGRSAVSATSVVTLLFLALHAPLYLPGQLYEGLPVWPLPLILVSGSVLLTWIYLRTNSALLAGLMHASLNGTVPLTWGLDPAWVWQARGITLPVLAVVIIALDQAYRRLQASRPTPTARLA